MPGRGPLARAEDLEASAGDENVDGPFTGPAMVLNIDRSPPLHENIQHITIGVDRSPQPMVDAVDHDDDLVQMPLVIRLRSIAPDAACERRPKPVDPEPLRFAAHHNAVLGQKVLDIRCAQREPMISPDRIGNGRCNAMLC